MGMQQISPNYFPIQILSQTDTVTAKSQNAISCSSDQGLPSQNSPVHISKIILQGQTAHITLFCLINWTNTHINRDCLIVLYQK